MAGMAFIAFIVPKLRHALSLTIRSTSLSNLMTASITKSSVVPVLPREMTATALTLGSWSERRVSRASITAGFWKTAKVRIDGRRKHHLDSLIKFTTGMH